MACQVNRTKDGDIIVTAPNGKASILFDSLKKLTNDKEAALTLWGQTYTPVFKNWFGDWEVLEEAKSLEDNVKGIYKTVFKGNEEKALHEVAIQANNSEAERRGVVRSMGERIVQIAEKMFPDAKVGDEFKPSISKVVDENGEPLVVYHGSPQKGMNEFDKSKGGKNTDPWKTGKRRKGLSYFLDNKGVADVLYGGEYSEFVNDAEKGEVYPVFLDIKDVNENTYKEKDYLPTGHPDDFVEYRSYVVDSPNQIKSVFNKGGFNPNDDNIYKAKNQTSIVGPLQAKGILGKRVASHTFEVPIDPADFNLMSQQIKAQKIAEQINKKAGKEVVQTTVVNGNAAIKVDPNIKSIVDKLDPEDIQTYKQYLLDNLYTNKDNPNTTELINNAAKLAKELGRDDLVNIARLLYKYLDKNSTLKTRVINDIFEETGEDGTKAYYNKHTNSITFGKTAMGVGTLEYETETVLHELLHGLTFQPWYKQSVDVPLSQEEKDFRHVVDTYYNYFKSKKGADNYAFSNAEEFLMGALLDKPFQEHLKEISGGPESKSFYQFLKDILKRFLGLFGIKAEDKLIDSINPDIVQNSMIDALSEYLSKMGKISLVNGLKEEGRNYGLSFAITAQQDYSSESDRLQAERLERNKMKSSMGDDLRTKLKTSLDKSILSIKSFGSSIRKRIPESQEGFKTIFKQLKKLEDPAYDLDQVDFFFDFTQEIQAIMNVAYDKIKKLQSDTTINDPDVKLKEYEDIVSAVRNFDPILSEIQGIKIQLESLGYRASLGDLDDMSLKRDRIESIYSLGVFPLVTDKFVDILSPSSKKGIEIAQEKMAELDKRIALANKNNNKSRVLQLERDKKAEQNFIDNQLTLNSDKVQSWLRGQMGDSNILQVWWMAGISNSNPIVAGVSKYIRDNVGQAAPAVLDLMNNMQSNMEAYEKATGRSMNKIGEFNKPLLQTYKVITGKNDKGEYEHNEKTSILHEFNDGHIEQLQKFKRDLTELYSKKRQAEDSPNPDLDKIKAITDEIKDAKNSQRQFMRDYMEQQYAPEVHDAMDMLYEDLGGYNAWDYMGPVISRIEDAETAIDQESDEGRLADLYKQLDDYNIELSRLGSLYEKSPDSRELKVAQQLKKRRELLTKYSEFKLTDKGKVQFETQWARMLRKLTKKEITEEKYERWLEDNTVTEYDPKFWEEKNRLLGELNNLYARMGATNKKDETIGKLYKDMEDITKAHRDSNGIINGREMPKNELADVKELEEEIEVAKDNIANIFGLTRGETIDLANKKSQIDEISSLIYFEHDPARKDDMEFLKQQLQDEVEEITSRKKDIDKRLLNEYFLLMKKLGLLEESNVTKYYTDESQDQLEQQIAKIDTTKIPPKIFLAGKTYQKSGQGWLEIGKDGIQKKDTDFVENLYKESQGQINYSSSDWYQTNHVKKMKFVKNEDYIPGDYETSAGEWQEVIEPTYAWKQTRPRDENYIKTNQPSLKYKTRNIKDQYVNKNYKEDINGALRPKVRGAKDDRFINKDYQKLANSSNSTDVATFSMLKYLTDTYFKAQESIPKGLRPGYNLPSIRKSETERLSGQTLKRTSQDMFEYLGQLARLAKDQVIVNEQDKDILYGYNDDFNGMVPIRFIGDIDAKDQSIDLPKSILTFASEMLKREQLIKVLPLVNAVKDIVGDKDNLPVKTKKGVIESVKKKFLPKGTELAKKSTVSNTALQINEIIKAEIYGEQMKDQPAAKLVNTSLKAGATVMLGLNLASSVQNYANAFTQSIMETESKNKNFNMKNYFKAQKIYYSHIDELMSDLGKYGNKSYMNQFFDYFGGINFKVFSKNNKTLAHDKIGELTRALSMPNTITEHMLNYHMGIAIALSYRVADGKGNMVPIFDAFTLKDGKLIQKPGFNITEKERKDMISRLNSSSRRVNGEYGDRILADKYVLGKLVTFMNRYLVPFVVKRYGARKPDIQDGIRDEGYWRLFGKLLVKDIRAKWFLPPIVSGWKYYTSEEKQAVVKSLTELGFTVMFALLIGAMGGDDNKRIKDNSILVNNLLYALKGIQQQNEAFMPVPGIGFDDLLRKIQNPFPILGKVKNLVSLIQDGSHTAWYEMGLPGVDEKDVKYMQKTGWHNPGEFKMFSDLQKLIGLQKLVNYFYPDEALKAQESMSRVK